MFAIPKVKSQKDAKKGKTKTECQFFVITSDKALLRKKKKSRTHQRAEKNLESERREIKTAEKKKRK